MKTIRKKPMTIDGLAKIMQHGFKSIDARFEKMATKEFVEARLKNVATKDDLVNFATKDDLVNFATKDDLVNFATKDDLVNFATKDDLVNVSTKDDLVRFATKDDIDELATMIHRGFLETVSKSEFNSLKEKVNNMDNKLDKAVSQLKHHDTIIDSHESKINYLNKEVGEVQRVLSIA